MKMSLSPLDYDLTTVTRYDRSLQIDNELDGPIPFLLLRSHHDRLLQAADIHAWDYAKTSLTYDCLKTTCERAVQAHEADGKKMDPYKIRVILTKEGILTATVIPTDALEAGDPFSPARFKPGGDTVPGAIWSVYLDTEPTPISIFTTTKSTYREPYDAARNRTNLVPLQLATSAEDVLLYNPEGEITESSVSNVALWRDGGWSTPPLQAGCLNGTVRQWLLEHELVREAQKAELMKDSLKPGDWILLFNAIGGCRLGKIIVR
jgi:branched-subunit amino acid aminotransferase/4-amino-4-deoxychorismate lyase